MVVLDRPANIERRLIRPKGKSTFLYKPAECLKTDNVLK